MTTDLSPILGTWTQGPYATAEDSGLDVETLFSRADAGFYQEVAEAYEPKLLEGLYDVRLLSIYLLQVFMRGGFEALPPVIKIWEKIIFEQRDLIVPEKKRDEHIKRRLEWWGRTTHQTLAWHRQKQSDEYKAWLKDISSKQIQECLDALSHCTDSLPESMTGAGQHLGQVLAMVREVRNEVIANEEEEDLLNKLSVIDKPKSMLPEMLDASERRAEEDNVTLKVSYRFRELVAKLAAYEVLVERGRFDKAALVSDDLLRELDSFDPRDYFPQLFTDFSQSVAGHADRLSPFWDERENLQQRLLRQYYKVDLQRFVEE